MRMGKQPDGSLASVRVNCVNLGQVVGDVLVQNVATRSIISTSVSAPRNFGFDASDEARK